MTVRWGWPQGASVFGSGGWLGVLICNSPEVIGGPVSRLQSGYTFAA